MNFRNCCLTWLNVVRIPNFSNPTMQMIHTQGENREHQLYVCTVRVFWLKLLIVMHMMLRCIHRYMHSICRYLNCKHPSVAGAGHFLMQFVLLYTHEWTDNYHLGEKSMCSTKFLFTNKQNTPWPGHALRINPEGLMWILVTSCKTLK